MADLMYITYPWNGWSTVYIHRRSVWLILHGICISSIYTGLGLVGSELGRAFVWLYAISKIVLLHSQVALPLLYILSVLYCFVIQCALLLYMFIFLTIVIVSFPVHSIDTAVMGLPPIANWAVCPITANRRPRWSFQTLQNGWSSTVSLQGFPNPGIPEIFQSRNPGIEPHSIPGFRD